MSESCEMPIHNASSEEVRRMLASAKTIAVVGLSDKADRDSHKVAKYLQDHGYRIIPVNPAIENVLGEKSYARLEDIPASIPIDIVDIFRKPDAVPEIVDSAIATKAKVIWMQLGIAHNAAADVAREAGLEVVMNKCILIEHQRPS
jgi:hypothetical protein